jgi:mannitol/fructose-specific phosphotransferase system IIA component (Ntr-type)/galactitol-specific phosphotransferase system IIB component
LHFAAAFERLKDERNKEKLRALIICASGLGTSMVLSAKIKKEFSDAIQIVNVLPLNRLDSIPMDEYDAIISTVKIDTAANNLNDKKVIYTSPMLKQEDIATIRDFINSNKKVSILRFLEFTEEDLFFVDKEFETKEEIINYMVNNMIKKGYLKEEDRESFFKRENISSTEIGNLIAIPHALDTDPEISKVSILMMKKPIIWEEEQVRLVILMSIEKRLYLEFGEIIEELYLRLENKEKVIELLSAKNYTEFIKILR